MGQPLCNGHEELEMSDFDIVKQLRGMAMTQYDGSFLVEGADEIEHLRATIAQLRADEVNGVITEAYKGDVVGKIVEKETAKLRHKIDVLRGEVERLRVTIAQLRSVAGAVSVEGHSYADIRKEAKRLPVSEPGESS